MSPTSSDTFQFILGRRSIRVYAPGDVGEAAITQLLQAAMAAPSSRRKFMSAAMRHAAGASLGEGVFMSNTVH